MMIELNIEAHKVPHRLNGKGTWYIKGDGSDGTLIIGDGKQVKRVKPHELEPFEGFPFHSPERVVH